ncbi:MAG: UDP-N-acetylmuramoyl-L-alanyl-D-glutamate--2,6-diaminopimelate ligase [Verrucomicrobia bacterium]|nr:MAG: UDP-N-acetylmuramoyl-L-alanyl-D-glutamate--2,6-diaminopimelate ligase [Verrucomicrobiota bacterium]
MKLETLLQSIEALEVKGSGDVEIEGIAYDSRRVVPGGLFVAVRGHKADGAQYITEALSNGAVAVVSENDLDLGAGVAHVRVPCARRALAEISNVYYGDLSRQMKIIGVTGTNGKTTTAYMIRDVLHAGGFLSGLLGTVAYEIGDHVLPAARTTPEAPELHSLLHKMKEMGCDSAVMEVSSHAIALQRTQGIDFNIGVFTNLTQDHLDYHKDMDTYYAVKARLFHSLEKGRSAVINLDDPWGRGLVAEGRIVADVVTYGLDERAMVRAVDAKVDANGTCFRVSSPWGEARICLNLLGRFNISNALAALAVGGLCGIRLDRMVMALENIQAIPGRLELVPNRRHKKVFVDYAHTDDALRNVLGTLREICKGKLIVVFGCGGNRDRGKRKLMGQAAAALADFSIITSDNPRTEDPGAIVADIMEGFSGQDQFEVILDRRDAIEAGIQKTGRKDILLVAGKGHETYQEFKETIVPFDDREMVREILG